MTVARVKFAIFIAVVLALPAALMALGDPQARDLGKLAMIISPGLTGFILNGGLGDYGMCAPWRKVTFAALVTLAVAGSALAIAICAGAVPFGRPPMEPMAAVSALAVTTLTSVLEELGWLPRFGISYGGFGPPVGRSGARPSLGGLAFGPCAAEGWAVPWP